MLEEVKLTVRLKGGLAGGSYGKEPACQCRRHKRCGFNPWVEDPLEDSMATHSSILAWRNSMDRGAWWATVYGGHKESDTTEVTEQQSHRIKSKSEFRKLKEP